MPLLDSFDLFPPFRVALLALMSLFYLFLADLSIHLMFSICLILMKARFGVVIVSFELLVWYSKSLKGRRVLIGLIWRLYEFFLEIVEQKEE